MSLSPANRELHSPIAASATSCDDMSTWASLHADLVLLIGWRLLAGDLLDYVRFRAVCTYWRSATACPRGRGITDPRFHPRRWMMLPEGHGLHPHDDNKKRFFNLSTGAFVYPRLPVLMDHRVIRTVEGLLLLGRQHQGREGAVTVRLLHPFTGDITDLPPLPLLVGYWRCQLNDFLCDSMTVCLSTGMDGVTTVMIVFSFLPHVLFATVNDKQWSYSSWMYRPNSGVISFQGKLYMLQPSPYILAQQIFQIGPLRYEHVSKESGQGLFSLPPPKAIAMCPPSMSPPLDLVECDSEVLVIGFNRQCTDLLLYRVADLILDKVLPVTSIGGNTIFLDIGRNISHDGYYDSPDHRRSMTTSHKMMPTIEGDTIVRHHPKKRSFTYPLQYYLSQQRVDM